MWFIGHCWLKCANIKIVGDTVIFSINTLILTYSTPRKYSIVREWFQVLEMTCLLNHQSQNCLIWQICKFFNPFFYMTHHHKMSNYILKESQCSESSHQSLSSVGIDSRFLNAWMHLTRKKYITAILVLFVIADCPTHLYCSVTPFVSRLISFPFLLSFLLSYNFLSFQKHPIHAISLLWLLLFLSQYKSGKV